MPAASTGNNQNDQMASTMKTMNLTMPLFSVFMCFTMPTGLGLYWIASAVVRTIQQIVINRHLAKVPMEKLIEQNMEKAAKKREKKGVNAKNINEMAQKNVRNIKEPAKNIESDKAKANMVKQFNEDSKK